MTNAVTKPKQGQVVEISSTMSLIENAVASNASIETLERLMALNERHEANEARKAFFIAMQRFQSIKPDLPRTQGVSFGANKTAYNFCPLPEIDKRLRGVLGVCELSYRFENLTREGAFGIRCIVTHTKGHSESTEMYAPPDTSGNKNSIQSIGSTSTYLQRYTLIAAFGLTTADEDDDGQSNSDLPLQRLLKHNNALRENLESVVSLKMALTEKDYYQAAVIWDTWSEEVKTALWVAPTAGGILTTEERKQLHCNEFNNARGDVIAEKQTSTV